MAERTENYGLALPGHDEERAWEALNKNWRAVDEVLAEKSEVIFGSYTGSDVYPRTIHLGFRPKAVLQLTYNGYSNAGGTVHGGLFAPDHPLRDTRQVYASITEEGFLLENEYTNSSGRSFYFLAFR